MPDIIPVSKAEAKKLVVEAKDEIVPVSKDEASKLVVDSDKAKDKSQPKANVDLYNQIKTKVATNAPYSPERKLEKPFYEQIKYDVQKPVLGDKNYLSRTIKESAKVKDTTHTTLSRINKDKQSKQDFSDELFKKADELNIPELRKNLELQVKQEEKDKLNSIQMQAIQEGTGKQNERVDKMRKELKDSEYLKELKILDEVEIRHNNFKARQIVENKIPNANVNQKYFEQLKITNPDKAKDYESKVMYLQTKAIPDLENKLKDLKTRQAKYGDNFEFREKIASAEKDLHETKIRLQKEQYQFDMESYQSTINHLGDKVVMSFDDIARKNLSDYKRAKQYTSGKLPDDASDEQKQELAQTDPQYARFLEETKEYEATPFYQETVKAHQEQTILNSEQIELIKDKSYLALSEYDKLKNKSQMELDKLYKENPAYRVWAVSGSPILRAVDELVSDIEKTPRTAVGMFSGDYGWASNFADMAIMHQELMSTGKLTGVNSSFTQPLFHEGADIIHGGKKYHVVVDDKGQAIMVRDKDKFAVNSELEQDIMSQFNSLPEDKKGIKSSGLTELSPMSLLNTLIYQATQMFAMGGIANGASKGAALLRIGEKAAPSIGMIASNVVMMNGSLYDQAINNPNVGKKEAAYFALTGSGIMGLMMHINPMEMKFFSQDGGLSFAKAFGKNLELGLPKEAALKAAIGQGFKSMNLETAKMVAINYGTDIDGQVISMLPGNADLNIKMPDVNSILETVVTASLASMPMVGMGIGRDYNRIQKEAMFHIYESRNPEKILANLDLAKTKGTISNEQYDNAVKKVQQIRSAKSSLDVQSQLRKFEGADIEKLLPLEVKHQELKESYQNSEGKDKERWKQKIEENRAKIDKYIDGVELREKAQSETPVTEEPVLKSEIQVKEDKKEEVKATQEELKAKKEKDDLLLKEAYHPTLLENKESIKEEISNLKEKIELTISKARTNEYEELKEALESHLKDIESKELRTENKEIVSQFEELKMAESEPQTLEEQERLNLEVKEQSKEVAKELNISDKALSNLENTIREKIADETVKIKGYNASKADIEAIRSTLSEDQKLKLTKDEIKYQIEKQGALLRRDVAAKNIKENMSAGRLAKNIDLQVIMTTYKDVEGLTKFADILRRIKTDFPELNLLKFDADSVPDSLKSRLTWLEEYDDTDVIKSIFEGKIRDVEFEGKKGGDAIRGKIDKLNVDLSGVEPSVYYDVYRKFFEDVLEADMSHLEDSEVKTITDKALYDIDNIPNEELQRVIEERIMEGYEIRDSENPSIVEQVAESKTKKERKSKTTKNDMSKEQEKLKEEIEKICPPKGGFANLEEDILDF